MLHEPSLTVRSPRVKEAVDRGCREHHQICEDCEIDATPWVQQLLLPDDVGKDSNCYCL